MPLVHTEACYGRKLGHLCCNPSLLYSTNLASSRQVDSLQRYRSVVDIVLEAVAFQFNGMARPCSLVLWHLLESRLQPFQILSMPASPARRRAQALGTKDILVVEAIEDEPTSCSICFAWWLLS